jgi:putative ABC transport system substrate-binding protein
MMDRRTFIGDVVCGALAVSHAALAQTPPKVARVGLLGWGSRPEDPDPVGSAFLQRLRDHGYVVGQNLQLEFRFADGRIDRLLENTADLVRRNVDVILVVGPGPIRAAHAATSTIPIVMAAGSSDPVAEGLAQSLGRPGGNITGFTYAATPERFGKQLETLKTAMVRLSRVAVLWDMDLELYQRTLATPINEGAGKLGIEVRPPVLVANQQELGAAFAQIMQQGAQAALIATGGMLYAARDQVAELALQKHLPTVAAFREFPLAGTLLSYGPDIVDLYRKSADYVDRILRGTKPADLPIEQPSKFELVINMKTAQALGLTIPQLLLVRADEVIR